MEGLLDTYSEQ
jgi:hypothetical protein